MMLAYPCANRKTVRKTFFCLFGTDTQCHLHSRKDGGELLGVDQIERSGAAEIIRLKKKTEQIRLFDRKADIIQSDAEHGSLLQLFYVHPFFIPRQHRYIPYIL